MTTKQIITLAKEKLGRDITEQEARDYILTAKLQSLTRHWTLSAEAAGIARA
ncbi:hypothetical protein V6615_01090 [Oscillospiraceae bacterium PP1C4]